MNDKRLHLLLAEGGNCEAAQKLRELFPEAEGGLELTTVSTVTTLISTLGLATAEILILDLALTQPDSLACVRRIHRSAPGVPIIVLANPEEKDGAAQCLREGATDYLLKGFLNPKSLGRVLRNALEQNTLKGLTDLLRDPSTELYIRDGFHTLGSRAMEQARRSEVNLVLLCAQMESIDAFRAAFGPGAAEKSLRAAAQIICSCFRRTDLVARIGETQFAALAVDAVEPSASVLRQRIEKRLAIHNQDQGPWGKVELRMSVGYWSSQDSRDFTEFLDAVETGLRNVPPTMELQTAIPGPAMRSGATS